MRWMLVACVLLAGCAGGSPPAMIAPPDAPVPPGMARITVTRSMDMLFLGVTADITVNEQRLGSVFRGQGGSIEVPAGVASVSTTSWSTPGRFTIRFSTVPGGRYDVEVAPRGALLGPSLALGMLGAALDAASNPEQGGAFTLAVISATPPIGSRPPPLSPAARDGRLLELRQLYDRGLITDEVLRAEQSRALAQ